MTILLSLLLALPLLACDGFLPENSLSLPAFSKSFAPSLTQEQFNAVIQKVEDEYAGDFSSRGLDLTVERLWSNARVNASAGVGERLTDRVISMFGGLARHPDMTPDAFVLVLCHEVGHHLAGTPLYQGSVLSAEAQSDYFATTKCARRVFRHENNKALVKISQVPAVARVSCAKAFPASSEQLICFRTAVASAALGKVLSTIPSPKKVPHLETAERTAARATVTSYPSDQCRVDTFFQGALCEKSFQEDFSRTDEVQGACHRSTGQTVGVRPVCWFRPKS